VDGAAARRDGTAQTMTDPVGQCPVEEEVEAQAESDEQQYGSETPDEPVAAEQDDAGVEGPAVGRESVSSAGGDGAQPRSSRASTSSVASSSSVESSSSIAGLERLKSKEIAPLAETTADDIKNFCATQACAEPEDVVTLARATLETLQALWAEIGLEPHECNNSTAEMFAEVKRVFENKLSTTQEIKCSLVSQIRLASARITTIMRETGTTQEESRVDECKEHKCLRASLAAHKEYLQSLEAIKISRAGTLSKRADELSALFHELDDALSPEQAKFIKLGSDYTTGRIEQFVTRITEQRAELATRQQKRADLVAEVRALWEELGMAEEWARGTSTSAGGEDDSLGTIIKGNAENELKVTLKNLDALQVPSPPAARTHARARTPAPHSHVLCSGPFALPETSLACLAHKKRCRATGEGQQAAGGEKLPAERAGSTLWSARRPLGSHPRASGMPKEPYIARKTALHNPKKRPDT